MPKLAIDVEARFAQVLDGLDALGKKADQQARSIEKSFKAAGVVLASVFSAAVISEQLSAFRSTLDSLADLDDAAAQAGTTVERFSEAWLFLRPTGVSVEQLSGIVDTLFKQLGKGGKEGEKVAKALGEIGVKARDAAGNLRDPVVLLEEMAKGLAEFDNDPNKVGLIYEILGKRAKDAIPVLEDLAKKQGETASITTELAAKSEELANKLREIAQEGENLRVNFLEKYIDDITSLIRKFSDLSKGNGIVDAAVGALFPKFAAENLRQGITFYEKEIARLNKLIADPPLVLRGKDGKIAPERLQDFNDRLREANEELARLVKQRDQLSGAQAERLPETDDWRFGATKRIGARTPDDDKPKKAAAERETEAEKLQKWLDQQVNTAEKYNLLEQTAIKILEAKEKKNHGITDALEEQILATARRAVAEQELEKSTKEREDFETFIAQLLDDQARSAGRIVQSYRELIEPTERYRQQLKEINELEKIGTLDSGLAEKARGAVFKQIEDIEAAKEKLGEMDEYAKTAAESIQGHFSEFLFDPFKDGVDGLVKNFSVALRRMAADALAANLMKSLLGDYAKTGTIGGILGGLFSSSPSGGFGTGSTYGNQDYGQFLAGVSATAEPVSAAGFSQVVNVQSSATVGSIPEMRRAVKDASLDAWAQSRKRNGMAAR